MSAAEEKIKLTATLLNNVAVGLIVTGFLKPILDTGEVGFVPYILCGIAVILHIAARWSLSEIEDEP
jgi:hypothetical protein